MNDAKRQKRGFHNVMGWRLCRDKLCDGVSLRRCPDSVAACAYAAYRTWEQYSSIPMLLQLHCYTASHRTCERGEGSRDGISHSEQSVTFGKVGCDDRRP